MMARKLLIALLLGAAPAWAAAQKPHELNLDFSPFYGQAGLAWRLTPQSYLGVALGGGLDELGKTVMPSDRSEFHTLEQLINVSAFARHKPSSRWDVEIGYRLGLGDVHSCGASDCWPGLLNGLYGGAFWGGRHWKVGSRGLLAIVTEAGEAGQLVMHLEILNLRFATQW